MSNEFIHNRPTFDTFKLFPGKTIQYVIPENPLMGEYGRTYDCIIKSVSPFDITLLRLNHRGDLIEEKLSVESFSSESSYAYKLVNPFADTIALKSAMKKIIEENSLEKIKEIANESMSTLYN